MSNIDVIKRATQLILVLIVLLHSDHAYADESKDRAHMHLFELSTKLSFNDVIDAIREKGGLPDKFNWNDVRGFRDSDGRVFLLVGNKMIDARPKMTSSQWLALGVGQLQALGILEYISFSEVVRIDSAVQEK